MVSGDGEEDVRVGDRYVYEDRKITISRIDGDLVDIEVLTEDGRGWSTRTTWPPPSAWTKAGSGPVPQRYCVSHPLREVEPGQFFCPECVDANAETWSGLSPGEAKQAATFLLEGPRHDPHD